VEGDKGLNEGIGLKTFALCIVSCTKRRGKGMYKVNKGIVFVVEKSEIGNVKTKRNLKD